MYQKDHPPAVRSTASSNWHRFDSACRYTRSWLGNDGKAGLALREEYIGEVVAAA
jgi:hypothetical protein